MPSCAVADPAAKTLPIGIADRLQPFVVAKDRPRRPRHGTRTAGRRRTLLFEGRALRIVSGFGPADRRIDRLMILARFGLRLPPFHGNMVIAAGFGTIGTALAAFGIYAELGVNDR